MSIEVLDLDFNKQLPFELENIIYEIKIQIYFIFFSRFVEETRNDKKKYYTSPAIIFKKKNV